MDDHHDGFGVVRVVWEATEDFPTYYEAPWTHGQRATFMRRYIGDVLCGSVQEARQVRTLDETDAKELSYLGQPCTCVGSSAIGNTDHWDFFFRFDDGFCMGATAQECWFD